MNTGMSREFTAKMEYDTTSNRQRKLNMRINKRNLEVIINPSDASPELKENKVYFAKFLVKGIGAYAGLTTYLFTKTSHMCGLMGYNPMLGDNCPGCDESSEYSEIMHAVPEKLRKLGLLRKK
ncbi:MAG: hypothetical protein V1886_02430 [archaeon]